MNQFTPDQDILNRIASILGQIAPDGAQAMVFRGKLYEDVQQGQPVWVDSDGAERKFNRSNHPPLSAISDVLELADDLRGTAPFANSPFTQFEVRLTRAPAIEFETADIPRDDTWAGLYMRPLSEISLDEAKALRIPEEEWQARQPS